MLGGVALIGLLTIASLVRKKKRIPEKQAFLVETPALDSTPVFEIGGNEFVVKRPGNRSEDAPGNWAGTANDDIQRGKRLSELP